MRETEINTIPKRAVEESSETQVGEIGRTTLEPPVASIAELPEKLESAAELVERQEARADAKRKEDISVRIGEIDKLLIEKYRILNHEVSVIGRRPLEEEIRVLENQKARLEKELESSEGKVGKIWGAE